MLLPADPSPKPFAGTEFDELSGSQQLQVADGLSVFSRVEPLHKLKLVEILQSQASGAGKLIAVYALCSDRGSKIFAFLCLPDTRCCT